MEFPLPTFIAFSGNRGDRIHVEGTLASAMDAMSPAKSRRTPARPRLPGRDTRSSRQRSTSTPSGLPTFARPSRARSRTERGLAATFALEMVGGGAFFKRTNGLGQGAVPRVRRSGLHPGVRKGHIVGDKTKSAAPAEAEVSSRMTCLSPSCESY